jgi:hypothetical protein
MEDRDGLAGREPVIFCNLLQVLVRHKCSFAVVSLKKQTTKELVLVAHACNPSYSGGRD